MTTQNKLYDVVMLPTAQGTSSRICKLLFNDGINTDGKRVSDGELLGAPNNDAFIHETTKEGTIIPQHLYIISDEEIKEGDWFVDLIDNSVLKSTQLGSTILLPKADSQYWAERCKKIVATTNPDLWGKGAMNAIPNIPKISYGFTAIYIKARNEGKPITKVGLEKKLVEYTPDGPQSWYMTPDRPDMKEILNLRKDGSVIIHLTKERTFTLEDIKDAYKAGLRNGHDYSDQTNFDQWFNEKYPNTTETDMEITL